MEKHNIYYCPHCFGYLSVGDKIIFKIKSKNNESGLVLLSAKLDDYTSKTSGQIKIEEKELYKFYCPLCSECLNQETFEMILVKFYMKDTNQKKFEIYFSGIFGEHCTYIIKDCKLEFFGPHYKMYMEQLEKYREYYEKHL